jgi:hypothetical protein
MSGIDKKIKAVKARSGSEITNQHNSRPAGFLEQFLEENSLHGYIGDFEEKNQRLRP